MNFKFLHKQFLKDIALPSMLSREFQATHLKTTLALASEYG